MKKNNKIFNKYFSLLISVFLIMSFMIISVSADNSFNLIDIDVNDSKSLINGAIAISLGNGNFKYDSSSQLLAVVDWIDKNKDFSDYWNSDKNKYEIPNEDLVRIIGEIRQELDGVVELPGRSNHTGVYPHISELSVLDISKIDTVKAPYYYVVRIPDTDWLYYFIHIGPSQDLDVSSLSVFRDQGINKGYYIHPFVYGNGGDWRNVWNVLYNMSTGVESQARGDNKKIYEDYPEVKDFGMLHDRFNNLGGIEVYSDYFARKSKFTNYDNDPYNDGRWNYQTDAAKQFTQELLDSSEFGLIDLPPSGVVSIPSDDSYSKLSPEEKLHNDKITAAGIDKMINDPRVDYERPIDFDDVKSGDVVGSSQDSNWFLDTVEAQLGNLFPTSVAGMKKLHGLKGEPPKVTMDFSRIFVALSEQFPEIQNDGRHPYFPLYIPPFQGETVVFDIGALYDPRFTFAGVLIIDYFRNIIGMGIIFQTYRYVRLKAEQGPIPV